MKTLLALIIATAFLLLLGYLNYRTMHKRAGKMMEDYKSLEEEHKEFLKKREGGG